MDCINRALLALAADQNRIQLGHATPLTKPTVSETLAADRASSALLVRASVLLERSTIVTSAAAVRPSDRDFDVVDVDSCAVELAQWKSDLPPPELVPALGSRGDGNDCLGYRRGFL